MQIVVALIVLCFVFGAMVWAEAQTERKQGNRDMKNAARLASGEGPWRKT